MVHSRVLEMVLQMEMMSDVMMAVYSVRAMVVMLDLTMVYLFIFCDDFVFSEENNAGGTACTMIE